MKTGSAAQFTQLGTIGIEEEFYIVDDAGEPVSATDELVYEATPPAVLDERLDHELFKFIIETQTPVIESMDEAGDVLGRVRTALVEHAGAHGYCIAAAGLHPTARWRELEHAEKPRYAAQLNRIQYPQHRNTTAGLHIHIGVDDADKAVYVANELRWYLPLLLALSANSPFWYGFDTGLQSARAKIFEALPNTGIPTRFDSFVDFAAFEATMVEHGSIADRGELWFDVRPHTELGTVEVRTPDAQADESRVLAFVEYVHALVMAFAQEFDEGSDGTTTRRALLDENKWRAIRYGRDASFILPDGSGTISVGNLVAQEADRLDITGISQVWEAESGAKRQRCLAAENGLTDACQSIIL